jgi:hypothetical protein
MLTSYNAEGSFNYQNSRGETKRAVPIKKAA